MHFVAFSPFEESYGSGRAEYLSGRIRSARNKKEKVAQVSVYVPRVWGAMLIDAGHIGEVLKKLANTEFEKWMETVSNPDAPMESRKYHWQLWESNKMTQMDKRNLMTWVFGRAWDQLLTSRLKNICTS